MNLKQVKINVVRELTKVEEDQLFNITRYVLDQYDIKDCEIVIEVVKDEQKSSMDDNKT